jgi:hypothetical protein
LSLSHLVYSNNAEMQTFAVRMPKAPRTAKTLLHIVPASA